MDSERRTHALIVPDGGFFCMAAFCNRAPRYLSGRPRRPSRGRKSKRRTRPFRVPSPGRSSEPPGRVIYCPVLVVPPLSLENKAASPLSLCPALLDIPTLTHCNRRGQGQPLRLCGQQGSGATFPMRGRSVWPSNRRSGIASQSAGFSDDKAAFRSGLIVSPSSARALWA